MVPVTLSRIYTGFSVLETRTLSFTVSHVHIAFSRHLKSAESRTFEYENEANIVTNFSRTRLRQV